MKNYILFILLTTVSITINAQNEFTGAGDGYSWDDPFNWISGDVPFNGEDILIEGFAVEFIGSPYVYGSLQLFGGANLLIQGDLNLSGNLNVDGTSVISPVINDLNDYAKVILGGDFSFSGDMDISFSAYVPQIGNSYQIIQGNSNFCNIATTDLVPENQSGGGYETTLGVQCESDGILFTVIGINYTTAKSWDGEAGNGLWNTPANWDPNGVPTATDIVIINSPTGTTVATDGAGTTSADRIIVGDSNQLIINGDLDMYSFVGVNETGSLNWKAGSLSRTDTNVQSFIINRGFLLVDGPGNKTLENGFEITSQGANASMVVAEKGFDINDGVVTIYRGDLVIDGDDITIGYTSGSQHSLQILNAESLIKTSGSGTSSVNLTDFQIESFASAICEEGILAFGENLTNNGTLSGSGSFQLPSSHIEVGELSPGSSPGILTIIGDLTTAPEATFNIEIDGTTAGTEYDQIIVTNEAILDGTINVTLGYLPANDASFEIVTALNLSSCNFPAQVTGNYNNTDYTFDVVCQNNTLYLNGPGVALSDTNFEVNQIKVYPNPTNNKPFINTNSIKNGQWKLYSQLGQLIKQGKITQEKTEIYLQDVLSGVYFIKIQNDTKSTITKKIIKG